MSWIEDLVGVAKLWINGILVSPSRRAWNFIGTGIVATDNPATGQTDVDFSALSGGGGGSALDWKDSVRLATTAALAASTRVSNVRTANANGALANIDGVAPALGNRILDKDHATGADRGIWTVTDLGSAGTPWILTRATDFDTSPEVTAGASAMVEEGATNGGKLFVLTTANPITLNTTALTFTLLQGASPGGAPVNVTKAAAAAGSSPNFSRDDHKHDITTATPGALDLAGVSAAEGSATSLARSDHGHSITGLLPFANIANGSACSVLGRGANSSGVMASISSSTVGQVLRIGAGPVLAFGAVDLADGDAVTGLLPIANIAIGTAFQRLRVNSGASALEYFTDGEINTQSGTTYTLVIGDSSKYIRFTNGSAVTFTVPTNASVAFPVGTLITGIQAGAGQVTFTPAGGVTINCPFAVKKTLGQFSSWSLKKVATDEWDLSGHLAAA